MHILALTLQTTQLADQKAFYTQVLGLPLVGETADAFTIQAGATRLTWQRAEPGTQAHYHMAFNIPENQVVQARDWMAARVPILQEEGEEIFHFETWNAHSFYFHDAARNGLEMIARHNLPTTMNAPFGTDQILSVSEISLGTSDAVAFFQYLAPLLGAQIFPPVRELTNFNPTGDDHGLFLLAQLGRRWFVNGGVATISPVNVTVKGTTERVIEVPGMPYVIRMVV